MNVFVINMGIFNRIIGHLDSTTPGIMGIIGERDGVVVEAVFDGGMADWINSVSEDMRVKIDEVIHSWNATGINFVGFIYNYRFREKWLTSTNIENAKKLLNRFNELPCIIVGVIGEWNSLGYKSYEFKVYKFFRGGRRGIRYEMKEENCSNPC